MRKDANRQTIKKKELVLSTAAAASTHLGFTTERLASCKCKLCIFQGSSPDQTKVASSVERVSHIRVNVSITKVRLKLTCPLYLQLLYMWVVRKKVRIEHVRALRENDRSLDGTNGSESSRRNYETCRSQSTPPYPGRDFACPSSCNRLADHDAGPPGGSCH